MRNGEDGISMSGCTCIEERRTHKALNTEYIQKTNIYIPGIGSVRSSASRKVPRFPWTQSFLEIQEQT